MVSRPVLAMNGAKHGAYANHLGEVPPLVDPCLVLLTGEHQDVQLLASGHAVVLLWVSDREMVPQDVRRRHRAQESLRAAPTSDKHHLPEPSPALGTAERHPLLDIGHHPVGALVAGRAIAAVRDEEAVGPLRQHSAVVVGEQLWRAEQDLQQRRLPRIQSLVQIVWPGDEVHHVRHRHSRRTSPLHGSSRLEPAKPTLICRHLRPSPAAVAVPASNAANRTSSSWA